MENWCPPLRLSSPRPDIRTSIYPSCACDPVAMSGLCCAPPVHCCRPMAGAEASTSTSSQMMGSASVQTLHQWPCSVGLTREAGALLCWWRGGCKSPDSELGRVAAPGPRPHHGVHDLHTTCRGEAELHSENWGRNQNQSNPNTLHARIFVSSGL